MTRLPFIAVLLLLPTSTVAEIKSLTISDDTRPIILFEKFRFTQTGHITISVSSVSVSSPIPDSSRFFLLSDESIPEVLSELRRNFNFCVLDSHYILHFFTFLDLSPPPNSKLNHSYQVNSPNDYAIFFANCVPETKVSMKIKTELYNLDQNGSKDYSPPGSTQLPGFFSFLYLSFFTLWIYFCWKSKQIVQRIHLLMAVLLLSKALTLFCVSEVTHNVKVTGMAQGWNVVLYVFRFIEDVLLFVVIVLIGKGWSFLKPKLQEKKKKLLMIVIPFRVLANVASIVIGETGPYIENWVTWNQIYLLADIISCCAIIFTMVWSICCSLRRETSETDGKTVKNLARLPLFRRFYVLVIVYLVFTRIGVFVLNVIAAYEYQWVSNAAGEIASLVFYILMFYMFRPFEWNEYFGVDDDVKEAAKLAPKKEELEL